MAKKITIDDLKLKNTAADTENESEEVKQRRALLKGYVERLSQGEDLESVRKDFVKNFQAVDPAEIMKAEQELIRDGAPIVKVQQLCDVHSALFHGATEQEKKDNAEKAVEASLKAKTVAAAKGAAPAPEASGKSVREAVAEKTTAAEQEAGHPVQVMTAENEIFQKTIAEVKGMIEAGKSEQEILPVLAKLHPLVAHYAKKGDLIYPLLKSKYGISGPSQVMWGVDDEIRDELNALLRGLPDEAAWKERVTKVLTRAGEMVYKEQNILFPILIQNFSEDEWLDMYRELKNYETPLPDGYPVWEKAALAAQEAAPEKLEDGEIVLPSGHLKVSQLRAILNTIPGEISFIDENEINRYFNEGEKLFKRPMSALDREVYLCHPPKVEPMVRSIITDFKEGKRDSVEIWMKKAGKTVLVRYMAVRDSDGKYVGTMEFVQDMSAAEEHFLHGTKQQMPDFAAKGAAQAGQQMPEGMPDFVKEKLGLKK